MKIARRSVGTNKISKTCCSYQKVNFKTLLFSYLPGLFGNTKKQSYTAKIDLTNKKMNIIVDVEICR